MVNLNAGIVCNRGQSSVLRRRPRFDDGILDKAEASFFYIGDIELCLRLEYHI